MSEREEFFLKKQQKLMTGPLRGYVSEEARKVIKRLEQVGFDPDLAFAIAESGIPEMEFYEFPEEDEK